VLRDLFHLVESLIQAEKNIFIKEEKLNIINNEFINSINNIDNIRQEIKQLIKNNKTQKLKTYFI